MVTFLILVQFLVLGGLVKVADGVAKQNLCLRWVRTKHSVIIQRQTVLGLWLPYSKDSYGDTAAAQEEIESVLASHRASIADQFGPVTSA